jgi:hypothetical protein
MKTTKLIAAEFARTVYSVSVPSGTTVAEMLEPESWMHVASKLRPTDRLEIVPEDGAWFAEVFVVSAGKNWAKVQPLRVIELREVEQRPADIKPEFEIKYGSAKTKFRVIRLKDNQIVRENFADYAAAAHWLSEHQKSMVL